MHVQRGRTFGEITGQLHATAISRTLYQKIRIIILEISSKNMWNRLKVFKMLSKAML